MSDMRVELIHGEQCHRLLRDQPFLARWRALHAKSPHATAFQTPTYAHAWYEAYRDQWRPAIVRSQDPDGELTGLWLLAHDPKSNALVHAGAHQAEYHTWLALPGKEVSFLSAGWGELKRILAFESLRFKYLPARGLGETLQTVPGMENVVSVRRHGRPLLNLDPDEIRKSFVKKSNKSRFNRLKRLGNLEFRRLRDAKEFDQVFDELIAYYDFRQGAVNHSTPFRSDPRKRDFHARLFAANPNEIYVTVTYLDDRPIAAFWGTVSGTTVHLGMLIHSPFLAEHSPGKLHMMQLTEDLVKEGKDVLDLTPGGDPWKERFANAHDEVAEAIVYRSAAERVGAETLDRLLQLGKQWLGRVGVTPSDVRAVQSALRRLRLSTVVRKFRYWYGMTREFRVYRADRTLAEKCLCDERVRRNSIADLLSFVPGESWQTRDAFLSSALDRLEQGESAYTVSVGDRLAHCGWMVTNQAESYMSEVKRTMTFPPGSAALYDFYTHPDFRGRGLYRATIGHMLRTVFSVEETQFAYISVLADNLPSRHVIETMGFEYQTSFFLRRRFGAESTWTGSTHARTGTANA